MNNVSKLIPTCSMYSHLWNMTS